MIVADVNLVAYLHLPGPKASVAEVVFAKDSEWRIPSLWQSEFRSILFAYMRSQAMSLDVATTHWVDAFSHLGPRQLDPDPTHVLELALSSKLSAYDAEYVALAGELDIPLVTSDKEILKAFPRIALRPEDF